MTARCRLENGPGRLRNPSGYPRCKGCPRYNMSDLPHRCAQSIIRRVNAPATMPTRNALKITRKRNALTASSLVAALAHGDVRIGRNPRDRHARSDPKANCQKDKKGKQFPHNRLAREGWVELPKPTMSGCSIAGAQFRLISPIVSFVSSSFGSGSRIKPRRNSDRFALQGSSELSGA